MTREARVPGGVIEYQDSGAGPVIVLVHGTHMNASVWDQVAGDLRADHHCVVPTLPLGGHRRPMPAAADLSPAGVAALLGELLEALDLDEVTLVGNDTGGALAQLLVTQDPRRIARLVLAWGWMAKRPVPRKMLDAWFTPLRAERGTRRDTARFMRAVDHRDLLAAAAKLSAFNRPALIVWAAEDRVMPPGHAQRLAGLVREFVKEER
jgi:pimeloyl-ACP methyl ester carboxylesterase